MGAALVVVAAMVVVVAAGASATPVQQPPAGGAGDRPLPTTPDGGPPPTSEDGSPLPPPVAADGSVTDGSATQTVPAQTQDVTADDPEVVDAAADQGVLIASDTAYILDRLGLASNIPPPLEAIIAAVAEATDLPEQTDDQLIELLGELEVEGVEVLEVLVAGGVDVSGEVANTLGGLDPPQQEAVAARTPASIDLGPYLVAIDDLALRNGRAPADGSPRRVDENFLAATVVGLNQPDEVLGTSTTSIPDEEIAPSAGPTSDGGDAGDDGSSPLIWLLAAAVVIAIVVGAALATRRRGANGAAAVAAAAGTSPEEDRFDALMHVSRRLAAQHTQDDVEREALRQATDLLGGADATTCAVVHRVPGGFELGRSTRDGIFVEERIGDGLLNRVFDSGHPVAAVVDTEPALRSLPASMVAVPMTMEGRISGVQVAVRTPERPFDEDETELLRKVGAMTVAALESARRADDLANATLTDPLTEVGNRRRLEQDLRDALDASDDSVAVVMVDLDHFKRVNDDFGHQAGDAVLRQVADILGGVLRPGDGVYRYGGEEFAMILGGASASEAVVVAERARESLRTATVDLGDGRTHRVTASMGVAAMGDDGERDGLALIARADRALYRAKEAGRDRVELDGAG